MPWGCEPPVMSEQSKSPGVEQAGEGAAAATSSGDDARGTVAATDPDGSSEARVLGLDSTDADAVLGAVASDTARAVLEALHEEPSTASGLADRVDCSLQTVQYHLDNLSEADLVTVVDSATSPKGQEMDVYDPTRRPVVVYAGEGDDGDDLRSMLTRLVSGVGFLGLLSLLVQELFGGDRAPTTEATRDTGVSLSAEAAETAGAAGGVEPGLLFFAGGLVVLVAYLGLWYLRRRGALDGLRPTA